MSDKSTNATRSRLGSALRKGLATERGEVDARLDANSKASEANVTSTGEPASEAQHYGGRGNTSSVKLRQQIRLVECVSNPFNPREFYSPEAIDALAVKLKRDGQYEAIKVTRNHRFPGKYVIIDGEYRSRAKKSLGEEFIDGEIFPELSDADLYLVANRINKDRTAQTVFDDAIAWTRLLENKVFEDQDALAASLDVSKAQVSKTLSLTELPNHLLRRMAENEERVGLATAYNIKLICGRKGEQIAEQILERVFAGELTVKRLQEMNRKAEEGEPQRRTKAHYRTRVQFAGGEGIELGELKGFQDGRTELKLKNLTEQQQHLLAPRLEALVREVLAEHASEANGSV